MAKYTHSLYGVTVAATFPGHGIRAQLTARHQSLVITKTRSNSTHTVRTGPSNSTRHGRLACSASGDDRVNDSLSSPPYEAGAPPSYERSRPSSVPSERPSSARFNPFDLQSLLSSSKEVMKFLSMGMVKDPWVESEGAYILRPPSGRPKAVVHFIGGAFVGAAPQITYRAFLKELSRSGLLIIVTPYVSRFDHMRIADEVLFKFDQAMDKLEQ
eukprot:5053491-Pyramimonas_sp.AAC.1